ncbi:DUF6036 family nucleotidyltransferase [Sodalis sp. RH16]|uniref:DUF6036 family nucleotidyltransferase n=1 Tax=Sodalis sp. RH16 TaxID=3394331 RepID=UPI0039B3EA27
MFTDTPFANAIFTMFSNIKIELCLRGFTAPGSCKAYIFGGCAMHLHTNIRISSDLDSQMDFCRSMKEKAIGLIESISPVDFLDNKHGPSLLVYDSHFNPALAPMHEDYDINAIGIETNTPSPLWVYLISKCDLAISKLGRFGDMDQEDIYALFRAGLSIDEFRTKAMEAADYAVGQSGLPSKIEYAISMYKELMGEL